MNGKILVVMTNHSAYPSRSDKTGLWLTELTHFYDVASAAGYEMDFVSPLGGQVPLDERSLKSIYLDKSARQHLADPAFMQKLKTTLAPNTINPTQYKAIYYTGGHGVMWDFLDNPELQEITKNIYEKGGIVSSVCHGYCGLLNVRLSNGERLIKGKKLTGFAWSEEVLAGVAKKVPYNAEELAKEYGARYEKAFIPFAPYVVQDGKLITGQNPFSAKKTALAIIEELEKS
ncbi:type 1 glutamine amidotransferase domain-containing protein [Acinetobacter baumannii]|nr:type 1 glutamine amidotransferase domain-containing protein [Acinetobacter baumannii]